MNLLDQVEHAIHETKLSEFTKQQLYLAYIQLHMDNPCLHPDDCLFAESGYDCWMAVLVYTVRAQGVMPDLVEYPTVFLKLNNQLELFKEFHEDLLSEGEETKTHTELLTIVEDLIFWTQDLGMFTLEFVMSRLEKLYYYHDFLEEDCDNPTSVLKECFSALNWIK